MKPYESMTVVELVARVRLQDRTINSLARELKRLAAMVEHSRRSRAVLARMTPERRAAVARIGAEASRVARQKRKQYKLSLVKHGHPDRPPAPTAAD